MPTKPAPHCPSCTGTGTTARNMHGPCETCGGVASPVTASAHPAPSTMAYHAIPRTRRASAARAAARADYAAGVAAERRRIAAWLREVGGVHGAGLARSLEGKVRP